MGSVGWRRAQVEEACRRIVHAVKRDGSFQFRHYADRNAKRTATEHNALLREAAEILHKDRQMWIVSRRPFGHIFEDGCKVSGVNVTVIANNLLPVYLQQQAG